MSKTFGIDTDFIVEGAYGLPVATAVDHGRKCGTIEWLLEAVERHASAEQDALAEFVVRATHGRSGAKRAIIGSIAGKILQHGSVPVVLTHPARVDEEPTVPTSRMEMNT
jgi:hypothetical protein